jgi:hypothetical protein
MFFHLADVVPGVFIRVYFFQGVSMVFPFSVVHFPIIPHSPIIQNPLLGFPKFRHYHNHPFFLKAPAAFRFWYSASR